MSTITCVCEKSFEAEILESVDLSVSPDAMEAILNGTFLSFVCPHCGYTVKPEEPLHVIDESRDIDIFLIPELERSAFLLGRTDYPTAGRIVIGYPELVEKLKIYNASLDDRAVELIKYFLLARAGAGSSPKITFQECEGDDLLFDITGLREDQIGKARIPRELYNKSLSELPAKIGEEPYSTILEPPYVSITKVEIEES